MSTLSGPKHIAHSLTNLISDIRKLGVEIPKPITAEVEIYRGLLKSREQTEQEYQNARSRLHNVSADEFASATDDVVSASTRRDAINQGLDEVLLSAAVHRLEVQVFNVILDWERVVVDSYNDCVSDFRLNEVAADLPDFSDPKNVRVFNLTAQQGNAVDQWRTATVHLSGLWGLYQRVTAQRGDTLLGPASANDLSTNILTACVLGDPGSFGRASSAAIQFASIAGGSDSVGSYGPLLPHLVPNLCGYDLHLNTLDEAAQIRRQIHHAA
jgi:hypothetical protein